MDQDKIKEAFGKAKQDIDSLKSELYYLNEDIQEIKRTLHQILEQQTNQQTLQQTNQQTNQHPHISTADLAENKPETHQKQQKITNSDKISHLEHVSEVLASLDDIKKELRIKFKHLTSQEMIVFSSIYQL